MRDEKKWLVIAGGPGISVSYLQGIDNQSIRDDLIFYHQIGTPECHIDFMSLEQMINQIDSEINNTGLQSVGIITHSFGNYLFMRYVEKYGADNIRDVIMISPCPLLYSEWRKALRCIVQSIPPLIIEKYHRMKDDPGDGVALFQLIYPYYTAHCDQLKIDVMFNAQECERISGEVDPYDHRCLFKKFKCPVTMIAGDQDPFFKHDAERDSEVYLMPNVGHYPHLENKALFSRIFHEVVSESQ